MTTLNKEASLGEDPAHMEYKRSRIDIQTIMSSVDKSLTYYQLKNLFNSNAESKAQFQTANQNWNKELKILQQLKSEFRFGSVTDPYTQNTLMYLHQQSVKSFPINNDVKSDNLIEPAIARYAEDRYGGPGVENKIGGGNPWVLTTQEFAKYFLLNIHESIEDGYIQIEANGINLSFYEEAMRVSDSDKKDSRPLVAGERIDKK